MYAVKPQNCAKVHAEIRRAKSDGGKVRDDAMILSVVAGKPVKDFLDSGVDRIARSMPNTPAQIGAGVTVWGCTDNINLNERGQIKRVLNSFGKTGELLGASKNETCFESERPGTAGPSCFIGLTFSLVGANSQCLSMTSRSSTVSILSVFDSLEVLDSELPCVLTFTLHSQVSTSISGSGPAYIFLLMEAMIDAGVHMGFSRETATTLVHHTLLGSTMYAMSTKEHPAVLRNSVTSPAGTTASAIYELENGKFRTVIKDAIWACYRRSLEMGGQSSHVGPNRASSVFPPPMGGPAQHGMSHHPVEPPVGEMSQSVEDRSK